MRNEGREGINKTCMYVYGAAKETMKDEMTLSIGIPSYKRM